MALGRSTEARTVTVTTTNTSAALTGAAGTFVPGEDVGRTITGTGIAAGATLSAVASDTAATLSAVATASGSVSAALGPATAATGYQGWSPETGAENATYTVAAKNAGAVSPGMQTNNYTRVTQRGRG